MAKVVGPLHSSEARGRMGGLVFNTYRGMATVKAKHAPAQPRTEKQLLIRAISVNMSRAWATNADQEAWNTYASTHTYVDGMGLTIRATGLNWYIALNSRLQAALIGPVETPPVVAAPAAVTGLALTPSAGSISAAWTSPVGATARIEFWLDGPRSEGRLSSIARIRLHSRTEAATSPLVIASLQPGRYTVWVRAFSETDGQVSPWIVSTTDVT